jgi:hypothetical protein
MNSWTLRQIAEHIISAVNAFDNTVGSNINPLQVESMIPMLRQDAIIAKYNGNRFLGAQKRIDSDWVQKFELVVDQTIQSVDAEYLIVNCPKVISINQSVDGFIYVGREKKLSKFYRAQSRDEIVTLADRGFINDSKHIVYNYADGQLEVYGNKSLKKIYVEAILQFPSDKPSFNEEFDEYPVSADILSMMVDGYKNSMRIAISQPADTISDMADTKSVRNEKSNLV